MSKKEIEEQIEEGLECTGLEETAVTEDSSPSESDDLSELEELQAKYDELNDRYLRIMAEYDNYRKRSQKEKDDIYPVATAAAIQKLLPVVDTIERANGFERGTEDFAKGFDMIVQNFKDVLTALGVEEVGAPGEEFNPNFHNAAMHIEDETLGQNVVSQVFQKGYKIGDKVIRYAMVQTAN